MRMAECNAPLTHSSRFRQIYFTPTYSTDQLAMDEPLHGLTFQQASLRFRDAVLIGVKKAGYGRGICIVNPFLHLVLEKSDECIVISKDDSEIKVSHPRDIDIHKIRPAPDHDEAKRMGMDTHSHRIHQNRKNIMHEHVGLHVLICGWRRDMQDVIKNLEKRLPQGSQVHLLNKRSLSFRLDSLVEEFPAKLDDLARNLEIGLGDLDAKIKPEDKAKMKAMDIGRITLKHYVGDASVRKGLKQATHPKNPVLDNTLCLEDMDLILVVSEEDKEDDVLLSDSHTIATCLLLRDTLWATYDRESISARSRSAPPRRPVARTPSGRDIFGPGETKGGGVESKLDTLTIADIEQLQMTCPIIAEILDVETRQTIEENESLMAMADFLVVNDIIARFIAVIACRREVGDVLHEFLGATGQVSSKSCLSHSGMRRSVLIAQASNSLLAVPHTCFGCVGSLRAAELIVTAQR